MVDNAREMSRMQACLDVQRVLEELLPVDQGVVLAMVCGEMARLSPRPADLLDAIMQIARAGAGIE